jgi:hypothetical protein
MKTAPLTLLAKRNVHNVPLPILDRMMNKYSKGFFFPAYTGIFPCREEINKLFPKIVEQVTPLHITCQYIGNRPGTTLQLPLPLGSRVNIEIKGISRNEHGVALVCSSPEFEGNHITITTKKGSKPVDVGKAIRDDNTEYLANCIEVEGIFGIMF